MELAISIKTKEDVNRNKGEFRQASVTWIFWQILPESDDSRPGSQSLNVNHHARCVYFGLPYYV